MGILISEGLKKLYQIRHQCNHESCRANQLYGVKIQRRAHMADVSETPPNILSKFMTLIDTQIHFTLLGYECVKCQIVPL